MNKELIGKLKALLAKTQENGCTQAETEAAMAAAQRIAARNNIELASVRLDTGKPADIDITKTDLTSKCTTRRPYHEAVAHVLVQCFDVKLLWRGNTPSAIIMGENTDVAISAYCWTWLESMIQRLYAEYLSTMPMGVARDAILARSYYYGVATGIIQNNKRVKEEAARQGGGILCPRPREQEGSAGGGVPEGVPHREGEAGKEEDMEGRCLLLRCGSRP